MKDKLKKFIDIHIPVSICNLKCHYCYVPQAQKYGTTKLEFPYSAQYIRKALSKERLDGICLFNICGMGETLIPIETIEITKELLKEGHYVTIVTNGTLTKRFEEFLDLTKDEVSRLMFKFSLHWLELRRTKKIDIFTSNVKMMKKLGASITIELTANDETEPYISEIIEYTEKEFGARCHISIPRDESSTEFLLQSKHSLEEFYNIWKGFNSELLDFKYKIWGNKRKEYCYAGEWSGLLNIQNGEWRLCYHSHFSENIFKDISKPIPFIPIGKNCNIPHCFNGHSWLTLGDIPAIDSHTYADVRDRKCLNDENWLNNTFKDFINQRLDKNNKYPHTIIENINFNFKKNICYLKKGVKKLFEK